MGNLSRSLNPYRMLSVATPKDEPPETPLIVLLFEILSLYVSNQV